MWESVCIHVIVCISRQWPGGNAGGNPGSDQRHPDDPLHLPLLQHQWEDDLTLRQGTAVTRHQLL